MRRSLLQLLAVLLLLPLLAACQAPGRSSVEALTYAPLEFHVPKVDRIELPNGIRLYLNENHELPLVAVTAMTGAGSIGVPAEKTGMAGLFAALLRTGGAGGRSPEQMEEVLDQVAANLSVVTDTYQTSFDLSVRAEDLGSGLAILADVIRRPGFDPNRLEIARRQAIEAVRRQNDHPEGIASRAMMKAVYGDHPLGRTPTEATLKAVSGGDLADFHARYFHPNNIWLAVSGDFQREELLRLLQQAFGDWPRTSFEPQAVPQVTAEPRPVLLAAEKSIPQSTILMGEIGIDKDSPALYAVRVMNYILGGGGFNSRLMREIRSDRGLAYSVYSYYQVGRRLPGPFLAGTETKSGSTVEAVRLMREIMEGMRTEPVSPEELNLAKESIVNSFIFGFDDPHDVVTQQMRLDYFAYPPDYLEKFRDRVAAVTPDQVLQAASQHLHPERLSVVIVGEVARFGDLAALGLPIESVKIEK